jgi:hypothetical protein
MTEPVSYETLASIKAVLQIAADDLTHDEVLNAFRTDVREAIDNECQRTFLVPSTSTTKTYLAPESPLLWVDDVWQIDSVVVGGVTLSASDYDKQPFELTGQQPHYYQLIRLRGGQEADWASSRSKVVVTGKWGYASTVPEVVRQVCQIMVSRMYKRGQAAFGNEGGTSEGGLSFVQAPKCTLDADCKLRLKPLVKQWHYANAPVGR